MPVEKFMITICGEHTTVDEVFQLLKPLKVKGHLQVWDSNRDDLRTSFDEIQLTTPIPTTTHPETSSHGVSLTAARSNLEGRQDSASAFCEKHAKEEA